MYIIICQCLVENLLNGTKNLEKLDQSNSFNAKVIDTIDDFGETSKARAIVNKVLDKKNEIVQEFKQENPEEYAKITESTPPAETQTKDQEQLSAQLKTPEAKQATTFLTELNTHLPSMLPIMIARLAMGEDIKCAA